MFKILWYLLFGPSHDWVYRNPASRRCEKCGRIENQYCYAWDTRRTWWEEMLPVAHSPEKCNPCLTEEDVDKLV